MTLAAIAWNRWYPGDAVAEILASAAVCVAIVSSAGWFAAALLRRRASLRHAVLLSALLACAVSPLLSGLLAAMNLRRIALPLVRTDLVAAQASMATSTSLRSRISAPSVEPAAPAPQSDPETSTPQPPPRIVVSPAVVPAVSPIRAPAPTPRRSGRDIATLTMLTWLVGTALLLLRLARSATCIARIRHRARRSDDAKLAALMNEVVALLDMRRQTPSLFISASGITPLAVGFWRGAVILPAAMLQGVADDELRDVLIHELAHLRRGDQRIVLLQRLVAAYCWPIVSVHALNRALCRAREELCDNVVLARGSRDAIGYGRTLLHVTELLIGAARSSAVPAVGMFDAPGELERRIAGLIDPRRDTRTRAGRRAIAVIAFGCVVLAGVSSAIRVVAPAPVVAARAADASTAPAGPNPAAGPKDPSGHFAGRVSGPDGKPLAGVRVYMVPTKSPVKDAGPVRARSDADGRFEFDAPDMTYTELDGLPARREGLLVVAADGYAPDWMHTWGRMTGFGFREDTDPIEGAPLDMHLAADDVPIHGTLIGPDGHPLADARVRLERLQVPPDRDLTRHIEQELNAGPGTYFLSSGPNYERRMWPAWGELIPGLPKQVTTDTRGQFTMSGLGRDRLAWLSISAPSIVDTTIEVMTRDARAMRIHARGAPANFHAPILYPASFTVDLKKGRTVSGVVRDRDTKQPIPGMWVGPQQNAVNPMSHALYPWETDNGGHFTITGLTPDVKGQRIVAVAPPGLPYQSAWVDLFQKSDAPPIMIECARGIPYHLKVVDEVGKPIVDADPQVTYFEIQPNPFLPRVRDETHFPVGWAGKQADGSYLGYVLPGPGAVLVKTERSQGYRPARVDPKAFFAPGRTNWTERERTSAYGTTDTLETSEGRYHETLYRGTTIDQRDYSAIVLVNPPVDSKPLELTATLVRDRPRMVTLLDPAGQPVVGANMRYDNWWEPDLRVATFPMGGLHPDRVRRVIFRHEKRKLIGFLVARGDGDSPYTVQMRKWGAIRGRLIDDATGKPLPDMRLDLGKRYTEIESNADATAGEAGGATSDNGGQFSVDELVPGQRYSAKLFRNFKPAGTAFENVVIEPGEIRHLDIRVKLAPTTAPSGG